MGDGRDKNISCRYRIIMSNSSSCPCCLFTTSQRPEMSDVCDVSWALGFSKGPKTQRPEALRGTFRRWDKARSELS